MPKLRMNKRLQKLFTAKQQIICIIGGRGSGKSIGVGDFLTVKMLTESADIYCLREFHDSIQESVHRVFVDSVKKRMKLKGWQLLENQVRAPNGARTVYKGANRNPDSMQSAQGFKYSWVEEAHRLSQSSIDKLLPTILRNPGAKCIFTANPQSSSDPFSQRFIVPYLRQLDEQGYYEDDLHLILVVNWRDNPWWNEEQEKLRSWDYENLSRAKYDWIWEGKFYDEVQDSIIKPEWFDAAVDAHKTKQLKAAFKPHGAVIASLDPFNGGSDAGGFCVRHGSILKAVKSKDKGEIDEVCDWATGLATEHGADWFVWDGDGMGTGLKRQIDLAFSGTKTKFHMFRGSLSGSGQDNAEKTYMPTDGDRQTHVKTYAETFKNNRAQYYIELADRFYNTYRAVVKGEYVDPDEMISIDSEGCDNLNAFRSEVCRIPRKHNPNGLQQIMSKQDMAKLDIESPNMADSVMMSLFKPPTKKARKAISYPKASVA